MSVPSSSSRTNTCVRLHGPCDLRIEQGDDPVDPPPGHVRLRVTAVGICGSDMHTYHEARIGDTVVQSPLILGHEFGGTVDAVGDQAIDPNGQPIEVGARVAVDPAHPCESCRLCRLDHPNLCLDLKFLGHWPDDGALQQCLTIPAANCHRIPDSIDDAGAALLETLGVAIHATNLAHLTAGGVAILGAGPIGLSIAQMVRANGGSPVFVTDRLPHRLALAERWGATPIHIDEGDPTAVIHDAMAGRGVDVVIEAAWAGDAVRQAADIVRPGGRLVLVGIPDDDTLNMPHGTARRKGLTIRMARRMKHTYPLAIDLMQRGVIDLSDLVSHRFPLEQTPEAFELNDAYRDDVVKVIIEPHRITGA